MKSKELKQTAKDALKGNWFKAITAAIIASFFGVNGSFSVTFEQSEPTFPADQEVTANLVNVLGHGIDEELYALLLTYGTMLMTALIAMAITLIISSFVRVGYAQFNLDLVESSDAKIGTLFACLKQAGAAFRSLLLYIFRVFLGTLCLIIPGIVMSYSYAMTDYVLADNPEMNAREVLAESRRIMRGNRWKLFCLQVSFFGPAILCILTLGIGFIWYLPYYNATMAAFYNEAKSNA